MEEEGRTPQGEVNVLLVLLLGDLGGLVLWEEREDWRRRGGSKVSSSDSRSSPSFCEGEAQRTLDNFLRIARVFLYRRSRGMSTQRKIE